MLAGHEHFAYSDGASSERYLEQVLRGAADLGSRSRDLDAHIRDWPSEYHLSSRRAQLLAGFAFDRSRRVLEVGCGCGAITRHLGESFDDVVAIEGSLARARLARLRCRDLDSVAVVCAPFQEIAFSEPFDVIFCIGVFEYSASFVPGDEPYRDVLRHLCTLLAPGGRVVLAIENQFGLKYFGASGEDHVGMLWEGIEGYHRQLGRVRTFGRTELEARLKAFFPHVDFYYPYPDYKVPDCVLGEAFLGSGRAGELVGHLTPRDYDTPRQPRWNYAAAILELDRNRMLPFFSNSFIVLAGDAPAARGVFPQQGIVFSANRRPAYAVSTRIVGEPSGSLRVEKRRVGGGGAASPDAKVLLIEHDAEWIDAPTLRTIVSLRLHNERLSLAEVVEPCRAWLEMLRSQSTVRDGVVWVPGEHVDSIWRNVQLTADGLRVIDREWAWKEPIPLGVLVVRAIHYFIKQLVEQGPLPRRLHGASWKASIDAVARALGVELARSDFEAFIELESHFHAEVLWSEREHLARDMRRQMFMLTSGTSAFRRRSLRIVRRLRSAFGRLRRGLARKFA